MDEARSLQYSISFNALTEQAEQNVLRLLSNIGKLRTAAEGGDIDVDVSTTEAEGNVRNLSELIGGLGEQSSDIPIEADTAGAEENIRDLSADIGSLGDSAGSVDVDVDTGQAEQNVRELTGDLGRLGDAAPDIDVDVDTADARRNIRELDGDVDRLESNADSIGSAFRKTFLAGIDSGNSFSSSLRSGIGGAFDFAGEKVSEFKENTITRIQGIKESVVNGAQSIGQGFAHPIETIKNGLGGAIDSVKGKFVDFVRGADGAADAADDVGDAAAGAEPDVERLGDAAEKSGGKFEKLGGILSNIGKVAAVGLAAATTAAIGFTASSLQVGAEFDASMSQVAATMGKTTEEIGYLRDAAKEMGSTTAFSASEAAEGINILAMAGMDMEKAVAASEGSTSLLETTLNLASAGAMSLESSASYLTGTLKGFGDEAENAQYYADMMAKGATLANTDVQGLGEALSGISSTAAGYSQSADSVTLSLLKLAEANVTGSNASTALGAAMKNIYTPSEKAKKALAELGISAYDSAGNARDFNTITGELSAALGNLSDQEANTYKSAIFGIQGLDAFNKMSAVSEDTVQKFSEGLAGASEEYDGLGAAAGQAATQIDNLSGDITLWDSALSGAQIALSEKLMPTMREFVKFGTSGLTQITEAFEQGGLSGAMEALGGVLSDGIGMVTGMLPSMIDAGMQLLGALGQGLLDNAPLLIDAAVQIITILGDGILSSLPVVAGAAMQIIASLASGIGGMLPQLIPSVVQTVILIAGTIVENLPLILDAGMQLIGGLAEGIVESIPILIEQLPQLIEQIVGFLSESLPTILEQGAAILTSLAEGLIGAIPLLVDQLPQLISSVVGFVTENLPTIVEQGVQILTSLATGIIGALPQLLGQLPAIISGIVGGLSENFPLILQTGVDLLLKLADGIISCIPQLVAQLPAIGAAILGALGEIPGMVIDVGKHIVEGLWSGISSMASWVADKVKGFASGIVDGIKGFLGIHSPSTVFAEIGDNMALGLGKGFDESMAGVTKDIEAAIPTELDGPELTVTDVSLPGIPDTTYDVKPAVEPYSVPEEAISSTYTVSPIVESYNPIVEGFDSMGGVGDVTYSVNPIIADIKTPPISDVYYNVEPVMGEYNPPEPNGKGDGGTNGDNADDDGDRTDNGDKVTSNPPPPEFPDGGWPTGGTPSTFAPVINITIEGDADDQRTNEMVDRLRDTVRELFDEFRQEELEHMAAKNQYAY